MDFTNITILSLVQAITEFLPISSSGHLHLFQSLFGLQPSLTLDIFLNTATLFSVLFFFRKELSFFFSNIKYLVVSTIPAVLAGFLLKDHFDTLFADTSTLFIPFLYTSLLLFSTRFPKQKTDKMTYPKALLIGIFQAIAIIPAISRSGSTIAMALLLGFSSEFAFKYSFSLFIPVSLGALVLGLSDFSSLNLSLGTAAYSFFLTFAIGLVSLYFLRKLLLKKRLYLFSFYTLILAFIVLAIS